MAIAVAPSIEASSAAWSISRASNAFQETPSTSRAAGEAVSRWATMNASTTSASHSAASSGAT
jgi:hypothetical protein